MFRKINNKKLTVIVFTVILAVSLAITAFAADQTGSRQTFNRNKPVRMGFSKMPETIKSAIDSLVAEGTITQEQADEAIKAYSPGKRKEILKEGHLNGELLIIKKDQLDGLVEAGTITQSQADAIRKIAKPNPNRAFRGMKGPRSNHIDELVTSGTITQSQADAINEAVKAALDSLKKK
ncbi:MAG: hypothetical protein GX301_02635 [Gracilibacteraceae bacterium]|jgi:polyhydroxyalkanoate synthesis regulator phasin|nr:hypothetical protein [Gracilibacteraceae bacterium]